MTNTEEEEEQQHEEEFKLHISRVPTKFNETIVKRILEETLGKEEVVKLVELVYPREDDDKEEKKDLKEDKDKDHRGFGFVSFASNEILQQALEMSNIKGGRKPTSKKLYTMYIRPYDAEKKTSEEHICYLWSQHRCPYGDECKFVHSGEGGCLETNTNNGSEEPKKKRGKCFAFSKTGKCPKGDDCPFSHDMTPKLAQPPKGEIPKSEKNCINWKTKGKCRKGDQCPYRHEEALLAKVLKKKKRKENKEKQPLSVRIFGMNYETTPKDIREFMKDCGPIQDISFPTFEDSGRSKGYCGVWFSSPKAVEKAIALDGQELMGRWLRIQAGKMYLKQWEEQEEQYSANKRIKVSHEEP